MMICLLGPVELRAGEGGVPLGPSKRRAVLAALAVDVGRRVSLETMAERVWTQPPPKARGVLYVHIARLRRLLAAAAALTGYRVSIERESGGYLLAAEPELVDVHLFRRLSVAAEATADEARRAAMLGQALDLWQSAPLADVFSDWSERVRVAWEQERMSVARAWAQSEMRLGRPESVIKRLGDLLTEYPTAEPIAAALMRALHRAGRKVAALELYTRMRERLVSELGVEPSSELRDLHLAVLRDGGEQSTRDGASRLCHRPATSEQLPADIVSFTVRRGQLAILDGHLARGGDGSCRMWG